MKMTLIALGLLTGGIIGFLVFVAQLVDAPHIGFWSIISVLGFGLSLTGTMLLYNLTNRLRGSSQVFGWWY